MFTGFVIYIGQIITCLVIYLLYFYFILFYFVYNYMIYMIIFIFFTWFVSMFADIFILFNHLFYLICLFIIFIFIYIYCNFTNYTQQFYEGWGSSSELHKTEVCLWEKWVKWIRKLWNKDVETRRQKCQTIRKTIMPETVVKTEMLGERIWRESLRGDKGSLFEIMKLLPFQVFKKQI